MRREVTGSAGTPSGRAAGSIQFRRTRVAALLGVGVLGSSLALADPGKEKCTPISGTVVPACTATSCLQGTITGDLSGTYDSVLTSLYYTPDGYVFTGQTIIRLDKGNSTITTFDAGTAPLLASGEPDLANAVDVLTITDGTGKSKKYGGSARITGGYVIGLPSSYYGQLCKRKG